MADVQQRDQDFIAKCLEQGLITQEQVDECTKLRDQAVQDGAHVTFAQIAVTQGYVRKQQAEEIYRQLDSERRTPMRIGGFEIIEKIGSGGMGTVFKARQLSMNRLVALKVLPPKLTKNKSYIERFKREAIAAAKLNHPNIVHGIDAGVEQGFYYFAMEYVDGESLGEIIEREAPLDEVRALRITRDVAKALEHASEFGIVHRDIKPGNILITKRGVSKLSDLGLAKVQRKEKSFVTQTGFAVGTPHYISPEQAQGRREVDVRADIYSLGVTLYHMLTGDVPFPDDSPLVVMTKHLNEPIPPLRQANPAVSIRTQQIMDKMTAKKLKDRYQTATELVADLEEALAQLESPGAQIAARFKADHTPTPAHPVPAADRDGPTAEFAQPRPSAPAPAPAPAAAPAPASAPAPVPAPAPEPEVLRTAAQAPVTLSRPGGLASKPAPPRPGRAWELKHPASEPRSMPPAPHIDEESETAIDMLRSKMKTQSQTKQQLGRLSPRSRLVTQIADIQGKAKSYLEETLERYGGWQRMLLNPQVIGMIILSLLFLILMVKILLFAFSCGHPRPAPVAPPRATVKTPVVEPPAARTPPAVKTVAPPVRTTVPPGETTTAPPPAVVPAEPLPQLLKDGFARAARHADAGEFGEAVAILEDLPTRVDDRDYAPQIGAQIAAARARASQLLQKTLAETERLTAAGKYDEAILALRQFHTGISDIDLQAALKLPHVENAAIESDIVHWRFSSAEARCALKRKSAAGRVRIYLSHIGRFIALREAILDGIRAKERIALPVVGPRKVRFVVRPATDEYVTIQDGADGPTSQVKWADLDAESLWGIASKAVDRESGENALGLALLAAYLNLERDARQALLQAQQLNASGYDEVKKFVDIRFEPPQEAATGLAKAADTLDEFGRRLSGGGGWGRYVIIGVFVVGLALVLFRLGKAVTRR